MCSEKKIIKRPLLIGLTGGIGSGKSTIAKIFNSMGAKVYNSDIEAKGIINTDDETIALIKQNFGDDIYDSNGLNSKKMAQLVFNNNAALEVLNSIVHPRVKKHFEEWVRHNNEEKILIKEAAILIESGAYKGLDKIIVVIAPEELRINRVVERDGVKEIDVRKRIQSQLNDEKRLVYANYVVRNNEKDLVIPQVLNIYNQLTSLTIH